MTDRDTDYETDVQDTYEPQRAEPGTTGSGTMNIPSDLQRLDQLNDFSVADDDTDPRGFDLYGRDNEKIGTIKNLLASPSAMRAYFAIVDTGGWLSSKEYLIPVSDLQFRDGKAYCSFTKADFDNAPVWTDDERDYQRHYGYWHNLATAAPVAGATTAGMQTTGTETAGMQTTESGMTETARQGTNEVRVPVVEETPTVRRNVEQTGSITLRKRAVTETEHIAVPVTHTNVNVETRDVPPEEARTLSPDEATLREGETLRVPIVEENVEVVKEPRVTKEVIVRADTETEQVQKDVPVRREIVDVDRVGDVDVDSEEEMEEETTNKRF